MMGYCAVPLCRNGIGKGSKLPPGVRMHQFPNQNEENRARLWWQKIKRGKSFQKNYHHNMCVLSTFLMLTTRGISSMSCWVQLPQHTRLPLDPPAAGAQETGCGLWMFVILHTALSLCLRLCRNTAGRYLIFPVRYCLCMLI